MAQAEGRARRRAAAYIFLYATALLPGLGWTAAAGAEDRLAIPFAPEIGVERRYEIVRSQQRSDGQRLERTLEVRSRVRLTPLSRNRDGFLYRFVITETEARAPGSTKPGLAPLLSRLAALTTGVPLVYRADPRGRPRRLVNTREVRQAFRGMLSELQGLVRSLTQAGVISRVERPNVEANVRDSLGALATLPDDALSRQVLKDAGLLFAAGGQDLAIGRFEAFAPRPGPPAAGQASAVEARRGVTSLDAAKRQAVVELRIAYDQAQAGAAVAALAERLIGAAGRPEAEPRDPARPSPGSPAVENFRVTESGRYLIDLRDGQPIALQYRRTTAFGERRLVEATRVERLRR